jgi:curved DNA-binding protein CbpA
MSKDYYRILGVLDDAEDIVIRAAYKALAQRYHPDKWAGDREEANRRMADINEAFDTLSDPIKRKAYDSTRDKNQFDEEDSENEEELLSSVERDWKKVLEYFPDLNDIAAYLAKISKSLEYTYKVTLLERKNFNNRLEFSKALEKNYLQKYFGSSEEIIEFAKELILGGKKEAARELNAAVNLLGSDVQPKLIIEKIQKEFGISNWKLAMEYASATAHYSGYMDALNMLHYMGCKYKEIGFFGSQVNISYKDLEKTFSKEQFMEIGTEIAKDFLKEKNYDVVTKYLR